MARSLVFCGRGKGQRRTLPCDSPKLCRVSDKQGRGEGESDVSSEVVVYGVLEWMGTRFRLARREMWKVITEQKSFGEFNVQ